MLVVFFPYFYNRNTLLWRFTLRKRKAGRDKPWPRLLTVSALSPPGVRSLSAFVGVLALPLAALRQIFPVFGGQQHHQLSLFLTMAKPLMGAYLWTHNIQETLQTCRGQPAVLVKWHSCRSLPLPFNSNSQSRLLQTQLYSCKNCCGLFLLLYFL